MGESILELVTGMDILRPLLVESDVESTGKVVVGTVAGDLHDIGRNLVIMVVEGTDFRACASFGPLYGRY